jgi:hypothetical protein
MQVRYRAALRPENFRPLSHRKILPADNLLRTSPTTILLICDRGAKVNYFFDFTSEKKK